MLILVRGETNTRRMFDIFVLCYYLISGPRASILWKRRKRLAVWNWFIDTLLLIVNIWNLNKRNRAQFTPLIQTLKVVPCIYFHLKARFVLNSQGPTVECYELEGLIWCKAKCNFSFKKISSQSNFFFNIAAKNAMTSLKLSLRWLSVILRVEIIPTLRSVLIITLN